MRAHPRCSGSSAAAGAEGGGTLQVGIDARYAFRAARRGIGEYVAALVTHLPMVAEPGDRFVLYVDAPAETDALRLSDPRFRVRRLPASNPLLFEEWALPRAARRDGVELLHLTANYGPSFPPCPTVYTIHDLIEFVRPQFSRERLRFRHGAGRAVRLRTLPWQARRARRVITVSRASREDLVRLLGLPPERLRVVPLGVDPALTPPLGGDAAAVRRELRAEGWGVPERYVLALAALDPRKNGPFLIRAFARAEPRLRAAGRTAELWMVGAERPEAYPLPLQPAPPWLALRGFAPRATLVRLMQGAAAFVFPSLYEGFGLPVLEAMACGVPVLASDRTSVPEVAGDAGLLFDPTDEEALAGALVRVLCDDALRQRLATRGPARAAGFTWAETARRTYAVFREALGLPASASSAAEAGSAPA